MTKLGLASQVAILELLDRRREREGPDIGTVIEQRIVDEALAAVVNATRADPLGPGGNEGGGGQTRKVEFIFDGRSLESVERLRQAGYRFREITVGDRVLLIPEAPDA